MEIIKPSINLFIVGAAKSGTTSLYNYLSQHPDTFFPPVKEPNYYSRAESHNPSAYIEPKKGEFYHNKIIRDQRTYFSIYDGAQHASVVADSSPSYLWDPDSAERIFKDYPDAKVLIILRNPIDRAFSQFLMDLRDGNQQEENFLVALKKDQENKIKIWGRAHLYEELGLYHDQVFKYLNRFKENTKVIIYEDFIKDTKLHLIETLGFLDLDDSGVDKIEYGKAHNPYKVPKGNASKIIIKYKNRFLKLKRLLPQSLKAKLKDKYLYESAPKPKMDIEARRYLYKVYEKDIEKLEVLLNRDLSFWKDDT